MVQVGEFSYRGWQRCTYMELDGLRLVVTNDVGPRIIACSVDDGPNLFKEFEEQLGKTSSDEYLLFGGHRLWLAPEAFPRSYSPDLDPVRVDKIAGGARFVQPEEAANRVVKSIEVEFLGDRRLRLTHAVANANPWTIELSPWAMTMMAASARAIVPQEPFRPHPEYLDPARTLTLWGYTRMDDPRVSWGKRYIQLREDPEVAAKFKLGIQNRQRWAACWLHGILMVRTFGFDLHASYPDGGSNYEMFTTPGFLEMETLAPLQRIAPGQEARHEEIWQFYQMSDLPVEDDQLHEALAPIIATLQFPEDGM